MSQLEVVTHRQGIAQVAVVLARHGYYESGQPFVSPSLASDAEVDNWAAGMIDHINTVAKQAKRKIKQERRRVKVKGLG